jgi:nucleoside-diphosphate-sugar epimerase
MTKTVAVTGATGFVGKHLVRALIASGYQVRALTRRPQKNSKNLIWIDGDLENRAALGELVNGVDVVFHLAGLIKAKKTSDFLRVNSHSIKTLVEILQEGPSNPHFILLSSLAAREPHLSSYANSKRHGEDMLTAHAANDMPWTILRPPGIYGPEDMETLKIFKSVAARIAPLPGGAHNRASWIYAPDLAQAMIAVAGHEECYGQILDVDDGAENGYSIDEMYQTAADILQNKPFKFTVPKTALKIFGHTNVLFSTLFSYTPMLTPEKINELCHPDWVCRGTHVMDLTGWKPETNLKQGFNKTLKWYKENSLV